MTSSTETTMFSWADLVSAARTAPIPAPALRAVVLAQWILESSRGTSELASRHGNFSGLKWRPEMVGYARRVSYGAQDGVNDYCAFANVSAFIRGYWHFIGRAPYHGWEAHANDPEGYIRFVYDGGFATSAGYADAVLRLLPEATRLLAGMPPAAAANAHDEPLHHDRTQVARPCSEGLPPAPTPTFRTLAHVRHVFEGPRPHGLEGAIIHYDGARARPIKGPDNTEWGAISTLEHGEAAGSTYATISRSGVIYLPSNMDWLSWGTHAGTSLCPATGRSSVSRFYVGFEVNCPGMLYPTADEDVFIGWFDAKRDPNGNVILNGKGEATLASRHPEVYRRADLRHMAGMNGNIAPGTYVPFTQKQYDALITVLIWLKRKHQKTFRLEYVFGHDEVSPDSKVDPGASLGKPTTEALDAAMTMAQFRAALMKAWADQLVI